MGTVIVLSHDERQGVFAVPNSLLDDNNSSLGNPFRDVRPKRFENRW